MLNIHVLHELTTTRPTEHYLSPPPHQWSPYRRTLLISYIVQLCVSFLCTGGEMLVRCLSSVLSSVLLFRMTVHCWDISKRSFSSILTFILDCMNSKAAESRPDICEIQQTKSEIIAECGASKSMYYLLVHSVRPHEEETRAHQGWILDLMIRVDQSLCVFPFGLHSLILRCQCTVSWLIKHVCFDWLRLCPAALLVVCVFCVWTSSPVNMFCV